MGRVTRYTRGFRIVMHSWNLHDMNPRYVAAFGYQFPRGSPRSKVNEMSSIHFACPSIFLEGFPSGETLKLYSTDSLPSCKRHVKYSSLFWVFGDAGIQGMEWKKNVQREKRIKKPEIVGYKLIIPLLAGNKTDEQNCGRKSIEFLWIIEWSVK